MLDGYYEQAMVVEHQGGQDHRIAATHVRTRNGRKRFVSRAHPSDHVSGSVLTAHCIRLDELVTSPGVAEHNWQMRWRSNGANRVGTLGLGAAAMHRLDLIVYGDSRSFQTLVADRLVVPNRRGGHLPEHEVTYDASLTVELGGGYVRLYFAPYEFPVARRA